MKCPCGSNKTFSSCCGLYLSGKKTPPTAEALMRSRYTAYTQRNFDYIEKTMKGEALKRFNRSDSEKNTQNIKWLKLDILFSEEKGDKGTVQFIATFHVSGEENFMYEVSSFEKVDGKWYYMKGMVS